LIENRPSCNHFAAEVRLWRSHHWRGVKPRCRRATRSIWARGLYRCGDLDGIGKSVLERYAGDVRGHYARHARAVLGTVFNR
jgi:hypothetical protein